MNDVAYVRLPAPEFGDTNSLISKRENKYSRGNSLITYRDPTWSEDNVFEYDFTYIENGDKIALLGFLRNQLGRRIKILDHLGIMRIGFVLTPDAEVTEPVRKGWSASFQFLQTG